MAQRGQTLLVGREAGQSNGGNGQRHACIAHHGQVFAPQMHQLRRDGQREGSTQFPDAVARIFLSVRMLVIVVTAAAAGIGVGGGTGRRLLADGHRVETGLADRCECLLQHRSVRIDQQLALSQTELQGADAFEPGQRPADFPFFGRAVHIGDADPGARLVGCYGSIVVVAAGRSTATPGRSSRLCVTAASLP